MRARLVMATILVGFVGLDAAAQGLGDAAERERKRREGVKKTPAESRHFSDVDLDTSWTSWREFKSERGGFAVSLPAKPETVDETIDTPAGSLNRWVYRSKKDQQEYVVMVTDYPVAYVKSAGAEALYDGNEKQLRSDFGGTPLTSFPFAEQGRIGRRFELSMAGTGGDTFLSLEGRMCLVGNRLFTTLHIRRSGAEEVSEEFLSSFRVLASGAVGARK
jgi:hypothetical protein